MNFADAIRKMGGMSILIGETDGGELICADLDKTVHLFVSGVTGTGKSVFVNSALLALIQKNKPEYLKFILFDSKMVEMSQYSFQSHLLVPVVTDSNVLDAVLSWVEIEMTKRLQKLSDHGCKSVDQYNELVELYPPPHSVMPRILIVIDDLTLAIKELQSIKDHILSLVINGRTVGIHMLLVTQSALQKDVKKIAELIPSKNTFLTLAQRDSRFLLRDTSACQLPPCGSSIFSPTLGRNIKVNTVMAGEKISDIILKIGKRNFSEYDEGALSYVWKKFFPHTEKADDLKSELDDLLTENTDVSDELDDLFLEAVDIVLETGQASVSILQRRLKLGYSRTARLVDQMEQKGIVGPFEGSKPRTILISKSEWAKIVANWPENQ